jgi:hypothetical protein
LRPGSLSSRHCEDVFKGVVLDAHGAVRGPELLVDLAGVLVEVRLALAQRAGG